MKLAIPVSSGRVSTAFDFAHHLLLFECEGDREISRTELVLEEAIPVNRARRLESLGVRVLICGAIAEHLTSAGIDVIPFVSGTVDEVQAAYLAGKVESEQFLMPGSTAEERREWRIRGGIRQSTALAKERRS